MYYILLFDRILMRRLWPHIGVMQFYGTHSGNVWRNFINKLRSKYRKRRRRIRFIIYFKGYTLFPIVKILSHYVLKIVFLVSLTHVIELNILV